jgi:ubiquinone/menaquinone biosynthesis C-methylase UbiE
MTGRGESHYVELPGFAAMLYEWLTSFEGSGRHLREIALDLASRVPKGKLLDVGIGPGKLLDDLSRLAPALRLYSLDISEAMVRRARSGLAHLDVDLRVGPIQSTGFPDGFFDGVTCSGNFYLWDEPAQGLDEIHRILVPCGAAHLYEFSQPPRLRLCTRSGQPFPGTLYRDSELVEQARHVVAARPHPITLEDQLADYRPGPDP